MEFFKKIDFKSLPIFKILGIGIIGLILITIVIWFVGFAFRTAFYGGGVSPSAPSYQGIAYNEAKYGLTENLSARNILPPISDNTTGGDAEEFEITEYISTIKTRNLEKTCAIIDELKAHDYVIFEDRQQHDKGCSYVFKVENDMADEVFSIIKELKPETVQENTHTIKTIVDYYTSETEILEKKLASVEKTLSDAQRAYDEITILATRAQDVESLAKIIDSKINLIERLTLERIQIKEQIDRLNRTKVEQLDRLLYTFFRVDVYEYLIFDFKEIKDSWTIEFKRFVSEFNNVIQDVTINLAGYILRLLQIAVYLLIALFVAKYGWRFVRRIWTY